MRTGIVYTETIVHAAAERFASEAPFQVVIVDLADGGRVTGRAVGPRVSIGDAVVETEPVSAPPDALQPAGDSRPPVLYFRKS